MGGGGPGISFPFFRGVEGREELLVVSSFSESDACSSHESAGMALEFALVDGDKESLSKEDAKSGSRSGQKVNGAIPVSSSTLSFASRGSHICGQRERFVIVTGDRIESGLEVGKMNVGVALDYWITVSTTGFVDAPVKLRLVATQHEAATSGVKVYSIGTTPKTAELHVQ